MTIATRALTVAFLIDRWEPERGGAERAMGRLAQHLGERGHRVLAFARRASEGAPGEFRAVATGGWSRASRERALARALTRAAREAGAEVTIGMRHLEEVDVFWPHGGAHARGLAAREESRRRATPEDGEESEDPGEPAGRHGLFLELERQACEGGARKIVCVSQMVVQELTELYPGCAPRLELVPNGIDLAHFHPGAREEHGAKLRAELGLDASAPLIAFLAHDALLKGLPALLDALALLRDPEVHLLLGGPRPLTRWKRRAERVLGAGKVHAFPSIDARAALSAADLLVHPTWRDTSGLVLLEALAVGTPVITTRRAGDASLVLDDVAGTVFEKPEDSVALAGAIARWLERVRKGAIDRDRIRACVAARGVDAWLAHMERIVVESARPRA